MSFFKKNEELHSKNNKMFYHLDEKNIFIIHDFINLLHKEYQIIDCVLLNYYECILVSFKHIEMKFDKLIDLINLIRMPAHDRWYTTFSEGISKFEYDLNLLNNDIIKNLQTMKVNEKYMTKQTKHNLYLTLNKIIYKEIESKTNSYASFVLNFAKLVKIRYIPYVSYKFRKKYNQIFNETIKYSFILLKQNKILKAELYQKIYQEINNCKFNFAQHKKVLDYDMLINQYVHLLTEILLELNYMHIKGMTYILNGKPAEHSLNENNAKKEGFDVIKTQLDKLNINCDLKNSNGHLFDITEKMTCVKKVHSELIKYFGLTFCNDKNAAAKIYVLFEHFENISGIIEKTRKTNNGFENSLSNLLYELTEHIHAFKQNKSILHNDLENLTKFKKWCLLKQL